MIATSNQNSKHRVTSTCGGGSGGVSGVTADTSPTSAPTSTKRNGRLKSQTPPSRARAAPTREPLPWATSWRSPEGRRPSQPVRCTKQRCGVRPTGSATPPRSLRQPQQQFGPTLRCPSARRGGLRVRGCLRRPLQALGCPRPGHTTGRCSARSHPDRPGAGCPLGPRHGDPRFGRGGRLGRTYGCRNAQSSG